MLRSMTGFSTTTLSLTTVTGNPVAITATLKSLNSRYFEATCKLPHQFSTLETELVALLKKQLHRGHVYLTMHLDNQEIFIGAVEPSLTVIKGYLNAIDRIKKQFNMTGDLSIGDLLQLPDVLYTQPKSLDDSLKTQVLHMIQELINSLINTQHIEGKNLLTDLERRVQFMRISIEKIEKLSVALVEVQKEKTAKVLNEISEDTSKYASLQKDAAYALLDKMDVHEEIVRFKSHLDNMIKTLNSADIEMGKRLDFTLQELSREINTVAAKCSDSAISALANNVKVELEKAREQVQNIV